MVEVVADGHGESQQFFECLPWVLKGYGNAAGLQIDTRRKVHELQGQDLKRGLDEKLRPLESILLQLSEDFGDMVSPFSFIIAVVALGDAAQTGDEGIPVGQAVGADPLSDAGSEDLLGAAAADAEEEFEGRTVDERPGQALKFPDTSSDLLYQEGFCGHWGASLCYCAPAQNATLTNQ